MSYILQGKCEGDRLDEQTTIEEFSLENEVGNFQFKNGTRILDAGCGSGVLCRYFEKKFPQVVISGCDLSDSSLGHARKHSYNKSSEYFKHDMVNNGFEKKYHQIFNRLVGHHLKVDSLKSVFKNFYNALELGGNVCIIDPDGIFLNLGTLLGPLQEKMKLVNSKFPGDLYMGRKIPGLLHEVGFKNVTWKIQIMDFHGKSREAELQQWKERFENSVQFYIDTFGSELEARRFFKEYTGEVAKAEVPVFYNKFIITAEKL